MDLQPLDPQMRQAVDLSLPQVVIALVRRAGGSLRMPVSDIDATGDCMLTIEHDPSDNTFVFRLHTHANAGRAQ